MKGKREFTKSEIEELRSLISQKVKSDRTKQKPFRDKMRNIGFYISDFTTENKQGEGGFDIDDFNNLIHRGQIVVLDDDPRNKQVSLVPKPDCSSLSKQRGVVACESFAPFIPSHPLVLVLGTMPGRDSLRLGQYYMNSGNRFWKIVAAAAGQSLPQRYEDRLKLLDRLHIALWDVFASVEREGSLDKNIRKGERNDIQAILEANPSIVKILFNGKMAYENALNYGCENIAMPSTSSSNTHYTQDELFSIWLRELKEI